MEGGMLVPAPYGGTCAGCSKAKCKCFYTGQSSTCNRCQRLGKTCESAPKTRKRKAPPSSREQQRPLRPPTQSHGSLEEKLDDIVSLLRAQNRAGQHEVEAQIITPSASHDTPSTSTHVTSDDTTSPGLECLPEFSLDTTESHLHIERPSRSDPTAGQGSSGYMSPVEQDVLLHYVSDYDANQRIRRFRSIFLPNCPILYIPGDLHSSELRRQKPLTWLVIMALTEKTIAKQFEMEDTIWRIISRRVVMQHLVNIDLLIGVMCFAYWSHYFKKDKPFMVMLTQLAVSLAYELELHRASNYVVKPRRKTGEPPNEPAPSRTLEERRTYLALFHLSSSTWESYRKTPPLGSSTYLAECIRILRTEQETILDAALTRQVECQILTNRLSCPLDEDSSSDTGNLALSRGMCMFALKQLGDLKRGLPSLEQENVYMRLFFHSTEIKIRDRLLRCENRDQAQRLQDLELTLRCLESWLSTARDITPIEWAGLNADTFNQFMQCVLVLFKLMTVPEEGWDADEVRRRADPLATMDSYVELSERVTEETGMVDAPGPRRGIFFRAGTVLRRIKGLMLAEMASRAEATEDGACVAGETVEAVLKPGRETGAAGDTYFADELLLSLDDEPWLSAIFDDKWAGSF